VQVITAIAPKVKELYCFQRSPQYSVPAQDGPVSPEFRKDIVDNWDTVWQKVRKSLFGFGFEEATQPFAHYSEEERQERLQKAWEYGGGFNFMFGPFNDVATNREANDYVAEFIRKIGQVVKDPEKARLLTPHDLYARRPLCDSNYYARFNQDNVHIVNCRETPIAEILPNGIKTADGKVYDVDVIVCATGFNAVE
jgi:cyclohexanone monooxygenase